MIYPSPELLIVSQNLSPASVQTAAEIEGKKLIDQHYGSLAQLAMATEPSELALSEGALADFQSTYGLP